jgi:hypothetical protein
MGHRMHPPSYPKASANKAIVYQRLGGKSIWLFPLDGKWLGAVVGKRLSNRDKKFATGAVGVLYVINFNVVMGWNLAIRLPLERMLSGVPSDILVG